MNHYLHPTALDSLEGLYLEYLDRPGQRRMLDAMRTVLLANGREVPVAPNRCILGIDGCYCQDPATAVREDYRPDARPKYGVHIHPSLKRPLP